MGFLKGKPFKIRKCIFMFLKFKKYKAKKLKINSTKRLDWIGLDADNNIFNAIIINHSLLGLLLQNKYICN